MMFNTPHAIYVLWAYGLWGGMIVLYLLGIWWRWRRDARLLRELTESSSESHAFR